jgi:phage repressor protein C with HTH and peptisase S24 domain
MKKKTRTAKPTPIDKEQAKKEKAEAKEVAARFGPLLRQIIKDNGWSVVDTAEVLGDDDSKSLTAKMKTSNPELGTLLYITKKLNIDLIWLITEIVKDDPDYQVERKDFVMLDYVPKSAYASWVDHFDDQTYGPSQPLEQYAVNAKILDGRVAQRPSKHMVVQVEGKSMEPSLPDKSVVVIEKVDRSDFEYVSGGIFTVLYDSKFVIKRIKQNQIQETGKVTLISDNADHGSKLISADEIRFMGKVLGIVEQEIN